MIKAQTYVYWKGDKVWYVGYEKVYPEGSTEVRSCVISVNSNLYCVCEHELSEWKEEKMQVYPGRASQALNDIFNRCTEAMRNKSYGNVVAEIRDMASHGLGLK